MTMSNVNVKNIYRRRHMSRARIGGTGGGRVMTRGRAFLRCGLIFVPCIYRWAQPQNTTKGGHWKYNNYVDRSRVRYAQLARDTGHA